jgi:carbon storage regulator CsrA
MDAVSIDRQFSLATQDNLIYWEQSMLVLSRRLKDTITFPELDIKIEILQVKGSSVRVGIDAPLEINVLRGEMVSSSKKEVVKRILVDAEEVHEVRNRMNSLTIAAGLAKDLLGRGEANMAATILNKALDSLDAQTVEPNQVKEASTPTGPLALLVDDSANEREMLAGFLRLHGYQVDTVVDGFAAMEYLEANRQPEFLLVDMNMPRLGGAGVIRKIRANPDFDGMKIFAVSGQTPVSAGVDTVENRVADWFQKPVQPARMIASINRSILN